MKKFFVAATAFACSALPLLSASAQIANTGSTGQTFNTTTTNNNSTGQSNTLGAFSPQSNSLNSGSNPNASTLFTTSFGTTSTTTNTSGLYSHAPVSTITTNVNQSGGVLNSTTQTTVSGIGMPDPMGVNGSGRAAGSGGVGGLPVAH